MFFSYCYDVHRALHSFPTRRSSDLRSRLYPATAAARRAAEIRGDVFRGLRGNAGFAEESEIPHPFEVAHRPGAESDASHVGETACRRGFVGADPVTGMVAASVDVHFHIRHPVVEHRREIFVGPDGMSAVAPTRAGDERWRSSARNRRGSAAGKRRRTRINEAREI